MVTAAQTLEIGSLGALFGSYLCEIYFWIKLHNRVSCQAVLMTKVNMMKKFRVKNEFMACFTVFTVLTYIMLALMNSKSHKMAKKNQKWSHIDEVTLNILIDPGSAIIIAILFLILSIGLITLSTVILTWLKNHYSRRYAQFNAKIVSCTVWSCVGMSMMTLRLLIEAVFRPKLKSLIADYMDGTNDTGFIIYFTIAGLFSEILAQVCLLVTLSKSHSIWLERLVLFPLGLPDGLAQPESELLA